MKLNADINSVMMMQVSALNDVMEELRGSLEEMVRETQMLRQTMLSCQACGITTASAKRKESCVNSPCYNGVECSPTFDDTVACGPCPNGTEGNGRECIDIDEVSLLRFCYVISKENLSILFSVPSTTRVQRLHSALIMIRVIDVKIVPRVFLVTKLQV